MSLPQIPPVRTPRALETRETQTRAYNYQPPSTLPDTIESPDWVYRWISTTVGGKPDDNNVSKRLDDQWEFVPLDEKDKVLKNARAFTSLDSKKNGTITIGSSTLGRMSRERAEARDEYYRQLTKAQITGVAKKNSEGFGSDTKLEQDLKTTASNRRPVQFGE